MSQPIPSIWDSNDLDFTRMNRNQNPTNHPHIQQYLMSLFRSQVRNNIEFSSLDNTPAKEGTDRTRPMTKRYHPENKAKKKASRDPNLMTIRQSEDINLSKLGQILTEKFIEFGNQAIKRYEWIQSAELKKDEIPVQALQELAQKMDLDIPSSNRNFLIEIFTRLGLLKNFKNLTDVPTGVLIEYARKSYERINDGKSNKKNEKNSNQNSKSSYSSESSKSQDAHFKSALQENRKDPRYPQPLEDFYLENRKQIKEIIQSYQKKELSEVSSVVQDKIGSGSSQKDEKPALENFDIPKVLDLDSMKTTEKTMKRYQTEAVFNTLSETQQEKEKESTSKNEIQGHRNEESPSTPKNSQRSHKAYQQQTPEAFKFESLVTLEDKRRIAQEEFAKNFYTYNFEEETEKPFDSSKNVNQEQKQKNK